MFTGEEILKILPQAQCQIRNFSVNSVITDSRKDCNGALFVALRGENFDGHDYLEKASAAGAKAFLVSKTKDLCLPAKYPIIQVPDTLKAYQMLARHHRQKMGCLVVGITGSSGKTSTKEILKTIMVHAFGREAVLATENNTNNHVGVPQNLLKLNKNHRFAIIEMGTNHPGEIKTLAETALPDISVISSIGNAHIEFLGSIDGVAREKASILNAYHDSEGNIDVPVAIFPEDGPGNNVLRGQAGQEFYTFGTENADLIFKYLGGNLQGSSFRLDYGKSSRNQPRYGNWSHSTQWRLHGAHQVSNAAAAALAALACGISEADIEAAFTECSLPGMRMSITEKDDITWINDAYNANPDSVEATLNWLAEFANKPTLKVVLGDMLEIGEQSDFFHQRVLRYALAKLPAANFFAVGKIMTKTVATDAELTGKVLTYTDSETAAVRLNKLIQPGDMVFLKASRGINLEKILV